MKFDDSKHDVEQFAHYLKGLGKMVGMSNEQVLEDFKVAIPPKIKGQLLGIDDNNVEIGKWEFWYCCSNPNFYNPQVYLC